MENFEVAKKALNKEQREAVEAIEGPVMVLAGPGTGKTQIVALRIAEILNRTQLNASNILALTFTESGVTALKHRLESIIGTAAYQVKINTFHGFSGEIIASFPHVFQKTRELVQLDEADQISIIEQILQDHSEWSMLRPLRNPTLYVADIARRIKDCKKEALTGEMLEKMADQEAAKATELSSKLQHDTALDRAKRLKEFSYFYRAYQERLEELCRYDYEDMILFVLTALRENDEVRASFQERYQYILVDEYQDTNNAQNNLIELLADFFPNPNLFVVGDDKQAIFRFQGASVANMLHFSKKYPMLKIVQLKENYRSTPEILSSATLVIDKSHTQIGQYVEGLSSLVVATRRQGSKPKLSVTVSPALQWQYIIEELQAAHKRGVPWSEMAVLFRRNKNVEQFRSYGEKAGLPLAVVNKKGILTEPVVQTLMQALRAASNPNDNQAVFVCARLILRQLGLIELLKVQDESRQHRGRLIEGLAKNEQTELAASKILDWNRQIGAQKIDQLLLQIIDDCNADNQLTPHHTLEDLELLRQVVAMAENYATSHPSALVEDFTRSIDMLRDHNLDVEVDSIAPVNSGVFVSSLHRSKGLEFELVVMACVDDQNFKTMPDRNVIHLPGSTTGLKNWQDDEDDDERRLFYVGMTRAKNNLILSYSRFSQTEKELSPCQFAFDAKEGLTLEEIATSPEKITETLVTRLKQPDRQLIGLQELAYIRERIKELALSASSLRAYQVCPRQYLLSHVLRLPMPETAAQAYGTSVHQGLEEFGRLWKGIKILPECSQLERFFEEAVRRNVLYSEQPAVLTQGKKVLASFYEKLAISPMPEAVEYNFSSHHVRLGETEITGKVDRIEPVDPRTRAVRFIDFKTSTAKTRNEIEGKTKNSDGEIKQQLVFYTLLAELDPLFPYQLKECAVQFVDDKETFRREVFVASRDDVEALKKEINQIAKELLERTEFVHTRAEFDKGCEICAAFPSL